MKCQETHNALTTQKTVAVHFKDVKIEETFNSQDQKLVETTNLCFPICPCSFCSEFRYKSNGISVLGVGFFSSDKFRLFN